MKQQLLFCVVNVLAYAFLIWVIAPIITDLGTYRGEMSGLSRGLAWLAWSAGLCVTGLIISCMVSQHLFHRIWHGFASLAFLLLLIWAYESAESYYKRNELKFRTAMHRKKDWCEWNIYLSSTANHPIAVGNSFFRFKKEPGAGYRCFRKNRRAETCYWGDAIWICEPEDIRNEYSVHPLPEELEITWFSFSESKVYNGKADLPVERLRELFLDKGYCVNGEMKKCNGIQAGLAPGGLVTVWAVCGLYNIELMQFRAEESDKCADDLITLFGSKEEIKTNQDYIDYFLYDGYNEDLTEYLSTHSIESEIELYNQYMKRYNTRLIFDFEDKRDNAVKWADIQCANGEYLQVYSGSEDFEGNGDLQHKSEPQGKGELRPGQDGGPQRNDGLQSEQDGDPQQNSDPQQRLNNEPLSSENAFLGSVKYIYLTWNNRDSSDVPSNHYLEIWIKNDEFFRIAREAWGNNPDKPIDIVVHIPDDENNIEIYAMDGTRRIDFEREGLQILVCNRTNESVIYHWNYQGFENKGVRWGERDD